MCAALPFTKKTSKVTVYTVGELGMKQLQRFHFVSKFDCQFSDCKIILNESNICNIFTALKKIFIECSRSQFKVKNFGVYEEKKTTHNKSGVGGQKPCITPANRNL